MNVQKVGRRVFRRSFCFETLWNYEKMQNIGFTFAILPALLLIHEDERSREQAVLRALEHVNTHPVMGPLLVGIVARLERDAEPAAVLRYRRSLMSAMAAYGDRVFWGRIKPLAAIWGTLVALCLFGSLAGGVVMLMTYNVPQAAARRLGFRVGWTRGLDALELLRSPQLEAAVGGMRKALYLGLGITAAIAVLSAAECVATLRSWGPALTVLPVIAATGYLLRRNGVRFTIVIYIALVTSVILFMLVGPGT